MKSFEETTSLVDLMTMALDDMEALIDNPMYEFDHSTWHTRENCECHICTAGAVMANRLTKSPGKTGYLSLECYPEKLKCRLSAIDYLRTGRIGIAIKRMGGGILKDVRMHVQDAYFKDDESAGRFIKFWRDTGLEKLRVIESSV